MGVRLTSKSGTGLRMQDLKDGQIAEIIDNNYTGTIVQRYKEFGVAIGKKSGNGWRDVASNTLQVRLLEDGELIEIFNNQ